MIDEADRLCVCGSPLPDDDVVPLIDVVVKPEPDAIAPPAISPTDENVCVCAGISAVVRACGPTVPEIDCDANAVVNATEPPVPAVPDTMRNALLSSAVDFTQPVGADVWTNNMRVPAGSDAQEPEKVVNVAVVGVVAPMIAPFIDPPEIAAPEIAEPEIVPFTIELLIMDPPEIYPALVILSTT